MVDYSNEIWEWIDEGRLYGATHLISVCDTFSYVDYPVFVMPGESVDEVRSRYDGKNMHLVNGVIPLSDCSNKELRHHGRTG